MKKFLFLLFCSVFFLIALIAWKNFSNDDSNYRIDKIDSNSPLWTSQKCDIDQQNCSILVANNDKITTIFENPRPLVLDGFEQDRRSEASNQVKERHGIFLSFGSPSSNYDFAEALFRENKFELGLKHLRDSATCGVPRARFKLASLYEEGSSFVPQDFFESYIWYRSTNEIYRKKKNGYRVNEIEESVSRIRALLTEEQLRNVNQKLVNLSELSEKCYREFSDKQNEYYRKKLNEPDE